ncbi:MAG TPA: 2-phospho-L-lactate transferase [Dehalococcoidia bacterium]|jgi:LPPG:FO 2-phospho-L-lactate transferase|nr:2-phospho-L-lactate transferase [Dehalococcoidia bacterium]|tara:strand:+ start:416 stop:1354 length:939 start_codon:yes stop_codon:yes gene_type:complete
MSSTIIALSGGVGGAKLLWGLQKVLPENSLISVINTGDDDVFFGLNVSPDLDTAMYTLANLSNRDQGWGLNDESFNCLKMLEGYAQETWFNLGDRDLATHLLRTMHLSNGQTLTDVTKMLVEQLNIPSTILPITNDSLSTSLVTKNGKLSMQEYFVKMRTTPIVEQIKYEHVGTVTLADETRHGLLNATNIIICPSNPLLSIAPMLSIPECSSILKTRKNQVTVISPLIGGKAFNGPAAKLMQQAGLESTVLGLAEFYQDIAGTIVIDPEDRKWQPAIEKLGLSVKILPITMACSDQKILLANSILKEITNE